MPGKPHTSLARVLDALGDVLLEPVAGTRNRPQHLDGVVIHDPLDTSELPARAVVLGVSVQEPADIARLLHAYGRRGATALVVRQPIETTPEVLKAADDTGVALLGLAAGASWAHLAAMLRTLLTEGDVGDASPQTLDGIPAGDLFAVANAVAALLDAPLTIEDRASRVLAFSGRQDEADQAGSRRSWAAKCPSTSPAALNATVCSTGSTVTRRPSTSPLTHRTSRWTCRGWQSPSGPGTRSSAPSGWPSRARSAKPARRH